MTHRSFYTRVSKLDAERRVETSQMEQQALAGIIAYLDALAARKVNGDPFAQAEIEAVNKFLRAQ